MIPYKVRTNVNFAFQIISFVLGILFNSIVILVRGSNFYRQRRISSYQFIILQIAFADLIYACTLAFEIEKQIHSYVWLHSLVSCRLVHCLSMTSASVPILLMMLLALERYQGIINTLTYHLRTRSIALLGILAWLIVCSLSFPSVLNVQMFQGKHCYENSAPEFDRVITIIYFVVFLLIPLLLTSLCHCLIYQFVRIHTKKMSAHVQRSHHRPQALESEALKQSVEEKVVENDEIHALMIKDSKTSLSEDDAIQSRDRSVFQKFRERGLSLRRRIRQRVTSNCQNVHQKKSRKLKVKILIAITICFFICNAPIHVHHLFAVFGGKSKLAGQIMFLFTSLMNTHCFINGIIYSLLDFKFRRDFKNLFKSFYCWKMFQEKQDCEIPRNASMMTSLYPDSSIRRMTDR